jgi:hypothetical protein
MSRQAPLEDENLAIRRDLSEMVEGTTVAEAELIGATNPNSPIWPRIALEIWVCCGTSTWRVR